MMEIALINSKLTAKINDEDYPLVAGYTWYLHRHNCQNHATTVIDNKTIQMHRLILVTEKQVDHKDRNGLNNQKSNLRAATASQNSANRGPAITNTYGYKGISFEGRRDKWVAKIKVNYRKLHLGYFKTKEEAALAYNEAALKYFGEFAYQNIIKE